MARGALGGLEPWLQPYAEDFIREIEAAGLRPRVTSVRRTTQQQAVLYQRAQRGLSNFPAAPPGRSKHEFGLAFDMIVEPREYLSEVGAYWKAWGGRWFPSDPIHFEV